MHKSIGRAFVGALVSRKGRFPIEPMQHQHNHKGIFILRKGNGNLPEELDMNDTITITTTDARAEIRKALAYLAGNDQDHAAEQNGIGFNGADSQFGHDLAKREDLTENQYRAGLKMLQKYRAQLRGAGIELPETLPEMECQVQPDAPTFGANLPATAPRPASNGNGKYISIKAIDGKARVVVTFGGYYPELVEKIKTLPGRHYDPLTKNWDLPVTALAAVRAAFPNFALAPEITAEEEKAKAAQAQAERVKRAEIEKLLAVVDLDKEYAFGHLFAHQKSAVRAILTGDLTIAATKVNDNESMLYAGTHGRVIVADDMGLGKTKEALVAAKAYHDAFGCYVFVIAPVSLRTNWLREAESVGVKVEVYSWAKIPDLIESMHGRYVLICDEAHYAQNLKSTRTQKMLGLADGARAVFMLTGTPIKNGRPVNLFPLLKATKHNLASDKKHYEKWFCGAKETRFSRWDTTGAAHLDELHRQTRNVIIRRLKKDCLDLPVKMRVMRKVEMSPDARREYDAAFAALREQYKNGVAAKFAEANNLRARLPEFSDTAEREELQKQIARLESAENADAIVMLNNLRHAGSIGKVESVVEWAEELIEQGEQVVLFTEFETSAIALHRKLGGELLTGDTPADKRQGMVDRFQNGISKVFVGTIRAGGVGITLTAAQTVILVDRPWTPGDATQAEDRLHRIGQRNAVTAIWAQYREVDEKVDKILEQKEERIELVLEGKRKTMRGIGSAQDVARHVLQEMFDAPALELSDARGEDLAYDDETAESE